MLLFFLVLQHSFWYDVPYIMWNWLFDNSIKVINVNYTYLYQFG